MNTQTNVKVEKKKSDIKVNLIFGLIEFFTIACYLIFGIRAILECAQNFDFEGMFDSVYIAIWALTIVVFVYSIVFISVKKLRTPLVVKVVIWNFIWIAFNIYGLVG